MATMDMQTRAKAIIVEIIRQNGGVLTNKTNLFKAFWKSHVAASAAGRKTLSVYPIVRMPQGPGIDKFDRLLGELLSEDAVATKMVMSGRRESFEFTLVNTNAYSEILSDDDRLSIQEGVQYVNGKSASAVSEQSHIDSRSWRSTPDGGEIDPDLDAMSDEEHEVLFRKSSEIHQMMSQVICTID